MSSTAAPKLRIGLLGLGAMGRQHLSGYAQIPDVEVSTRESERFRQFGEHDREALYTAMIDDPMLDALDLCLPTPLHARLTIASLKAGKHILCEKPMALNSSDCEAMLHAAGVSGRVLMIAHVLRFAPPYQMLKEAVESHAYGALESVEFTRSSGFPQWAPWLSDAEQSGGAILDLLVHDFDQAISILGQPTQIHAQSRHSAESVDCRLTYDSAQRPRSVRITGGWYADERPFSMGFRASFKKAELIFADGRLHLHRAEDTPTELRLREEDMYSEQQRYFVKCARSGLQPGLCPPTAAAQAVALANKAREKAMANNSTTKSAVSDCLHAPPTKLERGRA